MLALSQYNVSDCGIHADLWQGTSLS